MTRVTVCCAHCRTAASLLPGSVGNWMAAHQATKRHGAMAYTVIKRPMGVEEAERKREGRCESGRAIAERPRGQQVAGEAGSLPASASTHGGAPTASGALGGGRTANTPPPSPADTSTPPRPQDIGDSDYADELWAATMEDEGHGD